MTCDHCQLTFPERDAVREIMNGKEHCFCCNGCRAVFLLIRSEGLEAFYRNRAWDSPGTPVDQQEKVGAELFADDEQQIGVNKEIDILIDGIRCASCVWLNEKFLSRTDGVEYARINFATHKAKIRWDPGRVSLDRILERIQSIGYMPRPYRESEQFRQQKAEARDLLVRFGTAAFLSSQLMIYSIALYAGYFQGIDPATKTVLEIIAMVLTLPVILYSGMPFIRNTFIGLRHLHFTMDSLITLGSGSAFVYSVYQMLNGGTVYFDTSAMIITLILLGRYIETTAKGRASETIEKLSRLSPREARILKDAGSADLLSAETVMIPLTELKRGNLVRILPGELIPADGRVVQGESEANESILTGESLPVHKTAGSTVIGGAINLYGTFVFEVTSTGKDTFLAGVIRSVEDAQAKKPRLQILADRVVGYFVPFILALACITTTGYLLTGSPANSALMAGISVLGIACPCSLGLATPLAVLVYTTMASARGILVKDGSVIEKSGAVTHIIFDKTGTLTEGRPSLREVVSLDRALDTAYLCRLAASIENLSEHSLGRAITTASSDVFLPVKDFRAVPGRGVSGLVGGLVVHIGSRTFMQDSGITGSSSASRVDEISLSFEKAGNTVVFMGWDGEVRALFIVSDRIRQEAADAVAALSSLGLETALASGDNRATTEAVASAANIPQAHPEMSPDNKRHLIHELQAAGKRVMMIGDGINDAPALTEAAIGIAMGRGTDIAMESADAVLIRGDLSLIPYFMHLSRRAYAVIRQNIFWAFVYNIVALPLAVSGMLHPIVAAGAMAASSLFVVTNSLRIRKGVKT
ncbi:MAG: heavy metal translocating P-type ATPase [Nitrospirae bacterium]|nr:heavy metal translocating P-type ATPase [Nitrospirota bacterium]